MRVRTIEKYAEIQAVYKELYDSRRLRIDDVLQQLSERFFLSQTTVERILGKDITLLKKENNEKQMTLF
jgi:hypothetical protein